MYAPRDRDRWQRSRRQDGGDEVAVIDCSVSTLRQSCRPRRRFRRHHQPTPQSGERSIDLI
jgi:hypothetical protein